GWVEVYFSSEQIYDQIFGHFREDFDLALQVIAFHEWVEARLIGQGMAAAEAHRRAREETEQIAAFTNVNYRLEYITDTVLDVNRQRLYKNVVYVGKEDLEDIHRRVLKRQKLLEGIRFEWVNNPDIKRHAAIPDLLNEMEGRRLRNGENNWEPESREEMTKWVLDRSVSTSYQIGFVLDEVLKNAFDAHTSYGPGAIMFSVYRQEDKLVIDVHDAGVGVDFRYTKVVKKLQWNVISQFDPSVFKFFEREGGQHIGVLWSQITLMLHGGWMEFLPGQLPGYRTTVRIIVPADEILVKKIYGPEDAEKSVVFPIDISNHYNLKSFVPVKVTKAAVEAQDRVQAVATLDVTVRFDGRDVQVALPAAIANLSSRETAALDKAIQFGFEQRRADMERDLAMAKVRDGKTDAVEYRIEVQIHPDEDFLFERVGKATFRMPYAAVRVPAAFRRDTEYALAMDEALKFMFARGIKDMWNPEDFSDGYADIANWLHADEHRAMTASLDYVLVTNVNAGRMVALPEMLTRPLVSHQVIHSGAAPLFIRDTENNKSTVPAHVFVPEYGWTLVAPITTEGPLFMAIPAAMLAGTKWAVLGGTLFNQQPIGAMVIWKEGEGSFEDLVNGLFGVMTLYGVTVKWLWTSREDVPSGDLAFKFVDAWNYDQIKGRISDRSKTVNPSSLVDAALDYLIFDVRGHVLARRTMPAGLPAPSPAERGNVSIIENIHMLLKKAGNFNPELMDLDGGRLKSKQTRAVKGRPVTLRLIANRPDLTGSRTVVFHSNVQSKERWEDDRNVRFAGNVKGRAVYEITVVPEHDFEYTFAFVNERGRVQWISRYSDNGVVKVAEAPSTSTALPMVEPFQILFMAGLVISGGWLAVLALSVFAVALGIAAVLISLNARLQELAANDVKSIRAGPWYDLHPVLTSVVVDETMDRAIGWNASRGAFTVKSQLIKEALDTLHPIHQNILVHQLKFEKSGFFRPKWRVTLSFVLTPVAMAAYGAALTRKQVRRLKELWKGEVDVKVFRPGEDLSGYVMNEFKGDKRQTTSQVYAEIRGIMQKRLDENMLAGRVADLSEWIAGQSAQEPAAVKIAKDVLDELPGTDGRWGRLMSTSRALLEAANGGHPAAAAAREALDWETRPEKLIEARRQEIATRNARVQAVLGRKTVTAEGPLRGFDGAGSSLDLPRFQFELITFKPVKNPVKRAALTAWYWLTGGDPMDRLPSTPTVASKFSVTIRFERGSNPEAVEYVAPDYGIPVESPVRVTGETPVEEDGNYHMKSATALIFGDLLGLKGVRIVVEKIDLLAMAGGMESSNAAMVTFLAAAAILREAGLTEADIFKLAVDMENDLLGGLTGGQGHISFLLGGAWRHIWTLGKYGWYGAMSMKLLSEERLNRLSRHMALVQAGVKFQNAKKIGHRAASLTNTMWTDLLRDEDPVGLPLHLKKPGITGRATRALMNGDFGTVAGMLNKYVDIRDAITRRWLTLVVVRLAEIVQGKAAPDYALRVLAALEEYPQLKQQLLHFRKPIFSRANANVDDYVRRVFDPEHRDYRHPDYKALRQMFKEYGTGLKDISLYTMDPIGRLAKEARRHGIAIMPLGAGGPGANLIAVSSRGQGAMEAFFRTMGLKEIKENAAAGEEDSILTMAEVRDIMTRKDGVERELKGYQWFEASATGWKSEGFEESGLRLPAKPQDAVYNFWTGEFNVLKRQGGESMPGPDALRPLIVPSLDRPEILDAIEKGVTKAFNKKQSEFEKSGLAVEEFKEKIRQNIRTRVMSQNEKALAPLSQAFQRLERSGHAEISVILQGLYPSVLPYLIEGEAVSPVHHIAHVVNFMTEIAVGEGLNAMETKRVVVAALLHDIGIAKAVLPKVRESDIDNEKDVQEKAAMIELAVRSRKEHMELGVGISASLLQEYRAAHVGAFTNEDIEEIRRIVGIHDNVKIPTLPGQFDAKWLIRRDDRLMQLHWEADSLWMLSADGIQVDIESAGEKAKTPMSQWLYNADLHRISVGLFEKAFGPAVQEYGFRDGYLYRSKTGFEIFRRLEREAMYEYGFKPATGEIVDLLAEGDLVQLEAKGISRAQMGDWYIPDLKRNGASVSTKTIWALGRLGDQRAAQPLLELLRNKLDGNRDLYVWDALLELHDMSTLGPVLESMGSEHTAQEEYLERFIRALHIGPRQTLEVYSKLARNQRKHVRLLAIGGLGSADAVSAANPLMELWDDSDKDVRQLALWAVVELFVKYIREFEYYAVVAPENRSIRMISREEDGREMLSWDITAIELSHDYFGFRNMILEQYGMRPYEDLLARHAELSSRQGLPTTEGLLNFIATAVISVLIQEKGSELGKDPAGVQDDVYKAAQGYRNTDSYVRSSWNGFVAGRLQGQDEFEMGVLQISGFWRGAQSVTVDTSLSENEFVQALEQFIKQDFATLRNVMRIMPDAAGVTETKPFGFKVVVAMSLADGESLAAGADALMAVVDERTRTIYLHPDYFQWGLRRRLGILHYALVSRLLSGLQAGTPAMSRTVVFMNKLNEEWDREASSLEESLGVDVSRLGGQQLKAWHGKTMHALHMLSSIHPV
ncbi:MAG: hypothetical protein U1D99_02290, partial [Candidatus Omnitrophota bacterium]|nr:hypothetical protein [Candidatus Omnitrophota bacterium]